MVGKGLIMDGLKRCKWCLQPLLEGEGPDFCDSMCEQARIEDREGKCVHNCAACQCKPATHYLDHDALHYCADCMLTRVGQLVSRVFTGYVSVNADLKFGDD
jgi:hypothetical protein